MPQGRPLRVSPSIATGVLIFKRCGVSKLPLENHLPCFKQPLLWGSAYLWSEVWSKQAWSNSCYRHLPSPKRQWFQTVRNAGRASVGWPVVACRVSHSRQFNWPLGWSEGSRRVPLTRGGLEEVAGGWVSPHGLSSQVARDLPAQSSESQEMDPDTGSQSWALSMYLFTYVIISSALAPV